MTFFSISLMGKVSIRINAQRKMLKVLKFGSTSFVVSLPVSFDFFTLGAKQKHILLESALVK